MKKQIAIFIKGGIIQDIRSNVGQELEFEIVDADNEPDTACEQWNQFVELETCKF